MGFAFRASVVFASYAAVGGAGNGFGGVESECGGCFGWGNFGGFGWHDAVGGRSGDFYWCRGGQESGFDGGGCLFGFYHYYGVVCAGGAAVSGSGAFDGLVCDVGGGSDVGDGVAASGGAVCGVHEGSFGFPGVGRENRTGLGFGESVGFDGTS